MTRAARDTTCCSLTSGDLARSLAVDLKTVHRWVQRGVLRGHRTKGGHLRFRRVEVVRFLRQRRLPIPEETTSIPQKVPATEVKMEQWDYGTVAQILHIGPYSEEQPTVERLHKFIEDNGYEIAGVHEEEYLTSPQAKVQKTIIRYPIKKK